MTEVLSSKHYEHDAYQNMDFAPHHSSSNIDSDIIPGTPSSPLIVHPQLVEENICNLRNIHREHLFGKLNRNEADSESDEIEDCERKRAQLSLLALLLAAFRRSGFTCQAPQEEIKMDIGWPTDVRHVTHVTFDRFNGFLGLPVEFELEIPRRAPSASVSVFGVSAESMQCSYDRKGNSVPTILLLMQDRLYEQGGLKAEGIFRINAENGQEEHVRFQLNKGIVPHGIDVHCLAGLIKAWFRELPRGVLDSLSPDQVMHCHTEEECMDLVNLLPPTQVALLDWAVSLMADVVQMEEFNKMNARNIAMVFAPNMTQMSDPLTALMHAVQVMNFLKTLILKFLRERQEAALDPKTTSSGAEPPNGSENNDTTQGPCFPLYNKCGRTEDRAKIFLLEDTIQKESSKAEDFAEDFETLLTTSYVREANGDDDQIFFECGYPVSEMSNTADDKDSENDVQECLINGHMVATYGSGPKEGDVLKYSLNACSVRAGTSRAIYASSNNKAKHLAIGFSKKGRTDDANLGTESSDSKDSMQRAIDKSPSKGKSGGKLVGKVNQRSRRVEAWYPSDE